MQVPVSALGARNKTTSYIAALPGFKNRRGRNSKIATHHPLKLCQINYKSGRLQETFLHILEVQLSSDISNAELQMFLMHYSFFLLLWQIFILTEKV